MIIGLFQDIYLEKFEGMVHRPIFLGIAMGVDPKKPSLNLSITINDGFFVLGTKNYSFPIIDNEEELMQSPGVSPQLTQSPVADGDPEMEELKGMYIDLKKKIVLAPYFTTSIATNTCGQDESETTLDVTKRLRSKSPPMIVRDEARNQCTMPDDVISLDLFQDEVNTVLNDVLLVAIDKWLAEYTKGNAVKIVGAALSTTTLHKSEFADRIKNLLWNKYDILPCFFFAGRRTLDQQCETLARKCASLFRHENLPDLTIAESNKVIIDSGHIWFCSLEDYKASLGKSGLLLMADMVKDAKTVIDKKMKITFFSSTAQGGGVSLMRHSLVRFLQMLGIDASWYVCTPSPSVFQITKLKVHNILQNAKGTATKTRKELEDMLPGTEDEHKRYSTFMYPEDKEKVDKWLDSNYSLHWKRIVQQSAVVVLDDHQVARLAQKIKKDSPNTMIIYRSHIQIRGELLGTSGDPENLSAIDNVWKFLWESIQHADYFISHPFPEAVPKDVPEEKVIFQPAGTDQLDGLNKPLSLLARTYYENVFNRICLDNGENPVSFDKKYIVQVARFDPSKGINDLLDSYYSLFCMFQEAFPAKEFDIGLVLCGHGSVDDPEATTIFNALCERVKSEKFQKIKHLITKVRLPPSDQLLNMILANAYVTCQLSISEGFEVKVTESLMKKIPVIVYNVGGLPLQVKNGINGYIIERGNITEVAKTLFELITDEAHYARIKDAINPKDFIVITTPFQAMFWLKIFTKQETKSKKYYEEFMQKYLQ